MGLLFREVSCQVRVFASIFLVALQPNIKSTGAFVVSVFDNRAKEIKPTTQVTTSGIL